MSATRPPAFDDRFSTPIEASRRGAHRARPRPVSAGAPVLAGIAVMLLVIGGTYVVLRSGGEPSEGNPNLAAASAADDPSGAAGKPPASASATKKAAAADPTKEADSPTEEDPAADPDADVDRGIKLEVLNSVSVQGLAKKVQGNIEPDGWTVARTGNSRNRNLSVTKIYYGKESTRATADALLDDLGFGTVVKDAAVATDGLVVVLGQDAA